MGNKGSSTSEGSHRRRRDKKRTLSVKAGSHHNPAPGELLKRVRSNIPDSGNILREELFSASCVFREKGDDRNGGGSDTSIVGTGALVLTADQLWFSRYKPRNDLIVALKDIISAEAESAYKLDGKDIKVNFPISFVYHSFLRSFSCIELGRPVYRRDV